MEPVEYQVLYSQEERYWWYRGLRRLVEREVERIPAEAGTDRPPWRILDAGCGTGGMIKHLREAQGPVRGDPRPPDPFYVGIDRSGLALSLAAKRGGARLVQGSVASLPFRSGSFDLALSLDVLYHREVADDLEALRELRRTLRPGGFLILNLPAYASLRSSHDAAIHTARRYQREGLRSLLETAGLDVRRISYWNTLLFPGLAVIRLLRRPEGTGQGNSKERRGKKTSGEASRSAPASDVRPLPAPLNRILQAVLDLERAWLTHFDFPFGLSLLAVAQSPPAAAPPHDSGRCP